MLLGTAMAVSLSQNGGEPHLARNKFTDWICKLDKDVLFNLNLRKHFLALNSLKACLIKTLGFKDFSQVHKQNSED